LRSTSRRTRRASWAYASPIARAISVSEASVYRLKAHDLITGLAFIVMKAPGAFTDETTAPNQL
jgi:hypothetical protein